MLKQTHSLLEVVDLFTLPNIYNYLARRFKYNASTTMTANAKIAPTDIPAISPTFIFPFLLVITFVEVLRLASVVGRSVDGELVGIVLSCSLQALPCQPGSQFPMEHSPSVLLHDVLLKQ
jgi:hypothetical protein